MVYDYIMVVKIINALVTPFDFDLVKFGIVKIERITVEEAKKLINDFGFESYVGHEGTAIFLSKLLGFEIPYNRQPFRLEPRDIVIHLFLKERPQYGKELTPEEIEKIGYWLIKSEVMRIEYDNKKSM